MAAIEQQTFKFFSLTSLWKIYMYGYMGYGYII